MFEAGYDHLFPHVEGRALFHQVETGGGSMRYPLHSF
jgi:hypothetical protein